MNDPNYQPDAPVEPADGLIIAGSGPEPQFDPIMRDFLMESYLELKGRCSQGGLLAFKSLGITCPWLYRLTFTTRGLVRSADGEIEEVDRHVVALRFLPDYLRYAERFAMVRLIEPVNCAFHPNIAPNGPICVEIFAGEPVVQICQSLHDLIRWRLRQYDERDALNPIACNWGRNNVDQPIDERPLFGDPLKVQWRDAQ